MLATEENIKKYRKIQELKETLKNYKINYVDSKEVLLNEVGESIERRIGLRNDITKLQCELVESACKTARITLNDKKEDETCKHVLVDINSYITCSFINLNLSNKGINEKVDVVSQCANCGRLFVRIGEKAISLENFTEELKCNDYQNLKKKAPVYPVVNLRSNTLSKGTTFYNGILYLKAIAESEEDLTAEEIAKKMECLGYKDKELEELSKKFKI